MKKEKLIPILAPIFVIALGAIITLVFYSFMDEWVWVILAFVYWGSSFLIAYKSLGKDAILLLFQKPTGSRIWLVLSILVGLIPLSILLLNLELLSAFPFVTALWLLFAFINPFFEQVFWRGYLLSKLPFPIGWGVVYSAALFVVSHPLMWGIFSIANRSWMAMVSLIIMGIVWGMVYVKTKSLLWCYISHFMVNIGNLTVFVFLNLYIPSIG
ncbi:MAG: CPBP family glutamic-type intramembrane protease [Defluviitaleaceae bacterium]|nr:CPBP family glutamic-type intramembrane protease [Defluviitaleaceae bacterium]